MIHSAGSFQPRFNFPNHPTSPLVHNGPFPSIYSNLNTVSGAFVPTDFRQSPSDSASAFPSAATTPQPIGEDGQYYFDSMSMARRQMPQFSSQPNINFSEHSHHHFHQPMDMPFSTGAGVRSQMSFQAPPYMGHVNPTQISSADVNAMQHRHDQMFSLANDSDNEDDDGRQFGDAALGMADMSPIDESSLGR
ncbi:hypothetical protein MRB53_038423 [Persea americana]|nr:hypothetical protein MRB53_038423 [Persea americana]